MNVWKDDRLYAMIQSSDDLRFALAHCNRGVGFTHDPQFSIPESNRASKGRRPRDGELSFSTQ
jgi:hypothetical protein